ncbi:type IV toxin-antitoxin system YeeU family antitoxin, partial [Escherichia coli]|uniref:type IV toxin-antitoxin system YeeU family antitoxin n=1 Tax=Escherichia coli TaxID=562 RepID=UPI001EE3BB0B
MSDTLPGTTLPDDNHDRPWWGLPCTVTPCFGARLVQEGNRLHYLADRAGIRSRFSAASAYHLYQAFPLLMNQLELMLIRGELKPHQHHTMTMY